MLTTPWVDAQAYHHPPTTSSRRLPAARKSYERAEAKRRSKLGRKLEFVVSILSGEIPENREFSMSTSEDHHPDPGGRETDRGARGNPARRSQPDSEVSAPHGGDGAPPLRHRVGTIACSFRPPLLVRNRDPIQGDEARPSERPREGGRRSGLPHKTAPAPSGRPPPTPLQLPSRASGGDLQQECPSRPHRANRLRLPHPCAPAPRHPASLARRSPPLTDSMPLSLPSQCLRGQRREQQRPTAPGATPTRGRPAGTAPRPPLAKGRTPPSPQGPGRGAFRAGVRTSPKGLHG